MTGAARSTRARRVDGAPVSGRATVRPRPARRYFTLNGARMVAIAAAALTVIGMLYLIQTAHVASLGYQLSRLQDQRDQLAIDNARLGYQVAQFESLDTIYQVATQQLGMVPLTRHQFMQVQVPANDQLPAVAPLTAPPESALRLVWRELTGIGRSQAPAQGPPALPAGSTH